MLSYANNNLQIKKYLFLTLFCLAYQSQDLLAGYSSLNFLTILELSFVSAKITDTGLSARSVLDTSRITGQFYP